MQRIQRSLGSILSAVTLAGALSVPLITTVAAPSYAVACTTWAGTPYVVGNDIDGSGERSGCTSSTAVRVDLKVDLSLQPDPVIDYRSGTYTNVTLTASSGCWLGTRTYYIATSSGTGGSASSDPRRTVDCG